MSRQKKNVKTSRKAGRKQCSADGCRKFREARSVFCEAHLEENDGAERVVKVQEIEALRFGALDAEIRNAMQGIKLQDFELDKINREHSLKVSQIRNMRNNLNEEVKALRPEYDTLVKDLAKKYGIENPADMAIDPRTGVVRDLKRDT